jgi:ribosomal subunit interface protein
MKIIYSGKTKEFTPELEEKVATKIGKLGKLAEQRGEREVHLMHQSERHLHKVELTMNIYDHGLIGVGADPDLQTAICEAIEKLEKQLMKLRNRWRVTHRDAKAVRSNKESWIENEPASGDNNASPAKPPTKAAANGIARRPKIFQVNYDEDRKPMTLEEAILEMGNEPDNDYVVYRNSERNCLSVLVRRGDGNFDLIES